ncbi:hypothetical protein ACSNOK_34280, partial [Streptomyces sp. URMC 126]
RRVDLGVFAATFGDEHFDDEEWGPRTDQVTLQYKDPATGRWENVSLDENDESAGYVGYWGVRPHETFTLDLRLSVSASAPAGRGIAVTFG